MSYIHFNAEPDFGRLNKGSRNNFFLNYCPINLFLKKKTFYHSFLKVFKKTLIERAKLAHQFECQPGEAFVVFNGGCLHAYIAVILLE